MTTGIPGEQEAKILPLSPPEAQVIALPRHSRFTSYQLAHHVSQYPDLAYRVEGRAAYAVGAFWRQRPEIGNLLEMVATSARAALLERLLDAYRQRGCALVVLDQREQERNLSLYQERGFAVVDTLVQLERQGLRVAEPTANVPIRAMDEPDLDAVLNVERRSFPWLWWNSEAELLWYAGIAGVEIYVATAADAPERIVGYAGFTIFRHEAHLDRLAVDRAYQGQGYGAALLVFAMRQMSERGARRVALTTQNDNLKSQALYRRFGFRRSGWEHDILGLWLRRPVENDVA